jgi:sugar/nucleoside kinase (ribokinase family)
MPTRSDIAAATAADLRAFAPEAKKTPVLIGFDGFIDSIISVVDKRYDVDTYDPIPTIARFGEKIAAAAGKSSNYELVTRQQKLGGNGPIMANAMARAGFDLHYIGAVGTPNIHPIFKEFADIATLHGIAPPALTDALEFNDGKLMIGKHQSLRDVKQEQIDVVIGREAFAKLVRECRMLATVNWSMCPLLGTIWDALADEILPADEHKPEVFIDLTDPEKRTEADLKIALDEIVNLATMTKVTLGMNLKEASQVAHVLGVEIAEDAEGVIEATALALREAMGLYCAVVHPRRAAAGAMINADGSVSSATFFGPFIENPILSTGAGDNFNAGFCLGMLAGMPIEQCLCAGTATSGFYVRNAQSPTLEDLAGFCDALPEPQ